jgi:phosphopantothenoylcysteine decarboxylase/phosphopantothenate--cysteine ligase
MGIALADASAELGAEVILVLGPVNITPQNNSIKIINVTTAESMAAECISIFPSCDIAILAAAVADFTPAEVHGGKIKKESTDLILRHY